MSNAAFKRNFAALLKQCGARAESVVRATAIGLAGSMVEKSPVDTGRFKNNWISGIGAIDASADARPDAGGAASMRSVRAVVAQWKPGQTIYITNSLPYAYRLEYEAWSAQAPGGMVRITIAEFAQTFARAVREAKEQRA